MADEVGWDRLSLATVAARLGVKLPSLYKHIASLDALRRQVSVLGLEQLGAAVTRAVLGKSGRNALEALADAYRDYAVQHPGRYAATLAAPEESDGAHAEAAAAVLRVVQATLAGYGLTGDDAVDATRALRAALHGFVSLEAAGGFRLPVDLDRSYHRLVAGFDRTLATWSTTRPATGTAAGPATRPATGPATGPATEPAAVSD